MSDRQILTKRNILIALSLLGCAVLLLVWASFGYPTKAQVCQPSQAGEQCSTHNIIVAAIETVGIKLDRYGALLTALATCFIGYFTFTLKQSTDKLWKSSDDILKNSISEAAHARAEHMENAAQFREQIDITNRATNAAVMSADAAIRQAKVAESTLAQLERPYVFIFGVRGIKYDKSLRDFFVEYMVANYGKMPAIIEGPHIGFDISERAEPPMPPLLHDAHGLMASPILQAGEVRRNIRAYFPAGMVGPDITVEIEDVRAADIDPNEIFSGPEKDEPPQTVFPTVNVPDGFDVFFRAVIRYRGPFTSGHETGAVWLYNPGNFEFAVRGGDKHNYVK
jgi:hypothetical protein